jgi:hypothetical protein
VGTLATFLGRFVIQPKWLGLAAQARSGSRQAGSIQLTQHLTSGSTSHTHSLQAFYRISLTNKAQNERRALSVRALFGLDRAIRRI